MRKLFALLMQGSTQPKKKGGKQWLFADCIVAILMSLTCANVSAALSTVIPTSYDKWHFPNSSLVPASFSTPADACAAWIGVNTAYGVDYVVYPTAANHMSKDTAVCVFKCVDLTRCTTGYTDRVEAQLAVCPARSKPGDIPPYKPIVCVCDIGLKASNDGSACISKNEKAPSCRRDGEATPNPILPATAEKYRDEIDFRDSGPDRLSFHRLYRSSWANSSAPNRLLSGMGKVWTHNHSYALNAAPMGAPLSVEISTPDGNLFQFTRASTTTDAWSTESNSGTLTMLSSGAWTWHRSVGEANLNFDAAGRLQTKVERNGWTTSYTYNAAGQVASITNAFGRTLVLGYSGAGQLATLTTPDSRVFAYTYDGTGRLSTVTYPDTKLRTFVYENTAFPQALTGIFDEAGNRWGTFSFDGAGRAVASVLAGNVEQYQVVYSVPSTTVVDPLGTSRKYNYSNNDGVTNATLPSATGQDDAQTRLYEYTAGLPIQELDFKNVRTETTWDVARRLQLKLIRAANTTEVQTTTTQWHPTFSLPILITEAGRTTAYSYDTSGNRLTETVTHTGGNPKVQTRSWTYTTQGLIATETASNGGVTSYTYDARGNVLTETNPLSHVTTYTYDSANRLLSQSDPSGLMTTNTWDARDRLLTQAVGGMATTLTYKPYGAVETVTLPTGLVLAYTYDAAHRLTGWSNNRGESGTYTLDGMGNRTAEQIKDGAGNVAWTMVRTINNINRVSAMTEGSNLISTFGYDANGELISTTNGLNQTTQYGLDGLRRVAAVTDAANVSASLKFNALDAITQAKDFRGVITSYVRDAQGNAKSETSADLGWITTEYDNLGLPSQITNALNQATTITRDLLGRPISLLFADGKTTTLRYDLTANSMGYLSEVIDRSGTTEYARDAFSRVILKKQTLANGSVQQVSYSYNPSGTLAGIGYPNGGGVLTHTYDNTGRLAGLSLNGNALVSGIAWSPLGQPTAWTWAFSSPAVAASRVYDNAGRLTATEFSSYVYDAAGRITSLTQNLHQPGDADPTHGTIANSNVTWVVDYNVVGRITSFNTSGNTAGFGYDANGNRSSSSRALSGQTINRTYTIGANNNRLTGFAQTNNDASSTSVTYGYNAIGDLLSDGLRSYTYNPEGRLATATTGATDVSPTTRYAHNALGQRVFKTEPLYPPVQGDESNPGFMQSLIAFFTKLWSPATTQAEQLGYAYVYDEQGTLLAEAGSGGQNSAGQAQYIYLPTANGPMPIAAIVNGSTFAVHSDHLNTPRKLSNASGQAVWQWSYSAFGEDKPTLAKNRFANLETTPNPGTTNISEVKFNLRYPGQYADDESGLFYNGFRTYSPSTGRYTQGDPIGLDGGWNRFGYVGANPLSYVDPMGLQFSITAPALASIARPSVGAGAGTSGLGTLVDPLVGPFQPPEDPNDKDKAARCERLRLKIENLKKEVFDKRIPDLAANPGNLPYRIGPGEQLRDTVRGHEKLLNRQWRRLNELEDQQSRECPC